ncbi:MAG: hypothetical protein LUH46_12460 [Alistipes sp.]|nr:hypothetical protein [Alistipes sp.]
MKIKSLSVCCAAAVLMFSSCIQTQVGDEHFSHTDSDKEALAEKLTPKFSVENGDNKSNKVRVINHSGYDCQLDYIVGKVMMGHGKDNWVDVIIPFPGEMDFSALIIADGTFVDVTIPVEVQDLDHEIDPLFVALTDFGKSEEGKTWQWWADDNGNGSYSYIDGSWGCVGGGGYGWSATGPNWVCYAIGQADEWTGQVVSMDEWIRFDLNGGPNVTVHYSDGTEAQGTFSLTPGTTARKQSLGWVATMKLSVELPHQIKPGQASWYLDIPVAEFDVAMLDNEHLILIAPGGGGAHTICDPGWGVPSTHWTFKAKK